MKFFRRSAKVVMAGVLAVSMVFTPVAADEQGELESQNEDLKAQVAQDEQHLKELRENISDMEAYIKEIDEAISGIEERIAEYEIQKNEKQDRIVELNGSIKELEKQIADKEVEIDEQYAKMKMRIKFLYENVNDSYVEAIVSSTSFSEAVEKIHYLLELTSYDRRMMQKIQSLVKEVETDKAEIENQVSEIEVQVADIVNLEEAQAANQDLLAEAKVMKEGEIEEAEQEAREYEEAIGALNRQIAANQGQIDAIIADYMAELAAEEEARRAELSREEESIAAIRAEEEASIEAERQAFEAEQASIAEEQRKAAEAEQAASIEAERQAREAEQAASIEAERQAREAGEEPEAGDYIPETTEYIPVTTEFVPNTSAFVPGETSYIDTPSGGVVSGSSTSFIWPLNGYYQITSYFGYRGWDPDTPDGSGMEYHYGIDIYAPQGTPALAVSDGVVVYEGWSDYLGNVMCVYHAGSNVITEMHHLSGFAVGVGTRVYQGDAIAYTGATGIYCYGAHLHFAVIPGSNYNSTNYVDPLAYL